MSDLAQFGSILDLERLKPVFRTPRPYEPRSDVELRDALRRLPASLTPFQSSLASLLGRLPKTLHDWACCQQWPSQSAILAGPTGVGKSTAAAAAVRRMLARQARGRGVRPGGDPYADDPHRSVLLRYRWGYAVDLAAAAAHHQLGRGEPEEIRLAKHAPLLVLDDLGKEKGADVSWISAIAEHRSHRLPTIITTERRVDELATLYGAGTYRRLTRGATLLDMHRETR